MKPVIICIVVIIVSIAVSMLHMIHTADRIALVAGYFVSLGILPLTLGVVFGCAGVAFIGQGLINGLKTHWWIIVSGAIAAISSVGYVIWRMSQGE